MTILQGRSRQKIEHPLLEHPVADREHVVAAGNVERLAPAGSARRAPAAEPATSSLVPTATSTGMRARPTSACSVWREPRMQAASARRSPWSARRRRGRPAPARIGHVCERRRLERVGDRLRQPDAIDQVDAEAAEDRARARAPGAPAPEGGDARAHRIAHHVGALDAEMIEQRAHVVGHDGAV